MGQMVEQHQLDIFGLTSKHSIVFRTNSLSWTLSFSRVAKCAGEAGRVWYTVDNERVTLMCFCHLFLNMTLLSKVTPQPYLGKVLFILSLITMFKTVQQCRLHFYTQAGYCQAGNLLHLSSYVLATSQSISLIISMMTSGKTASLLLQEQGLLKTSPRLKLIRFTSTSNTGQAHLNHDTNSRLGAVMHNLQLKYQHFSQTRRLCWRSWKNIYISLLSKICPTIMWSETKQAKDPVNTVVKRTELALCENSLVPLLSSLWT